jgi:hypothetical protein
MGSTAQEFRSKALEFDERARVARLPKIKLLYEELAGTGARWRADCGVAGDFFGATCGEYGGRRVRRAGIHGSRKSKNVGVEARGNCTSGACGLDAGRLTDFNRGETGRARG